MTQKILVLDSTDNVGVALEPLLKGTVLTALNITLADNIPMGHKFALHKLESYEPVRKYGVPIGQTIMPIACGEHVHLHNIESLRGRGDRS